MHILVGNITIVLLIVLLIDSSPLQCNVSVSCEVKYGKVSTGINSYSICVLFLTIMKVYYFFVYVSDINECLNPMTCPPGSKCVNTLGSYNCPCRSGFYTTKVTMGCVGKSEQRK